LYYGGHLQSEGITKFLIDELHRYGRRDRPLKVCLAWTVHRSMSREEIAEQKEYLGLFGEIYFLSPEGRLLDGPVLEPLQSEFQPKEHAEALTGLREFMAHSTDARIVIGGKREGFQGRLPGIFEETIISLKRCQPLYLAGGFGGATLDVISILKPEFAGWYPVPQVQETLDKRLTAGIELITEVVRSTNWNGYNNGLSEEENALLAASYRPSEIAALVGRGMGYLGARSK
jgi:hypothetical protein